MEMEIQCGCGKTYGFDIEPVNNEMPGTVACPACGRDGTGEANAILAKKAAGSAEPAPSTVPSPPSPFKAPSTPMPVYPGARSVFKAPASSQNLPMGIVGALVAGLAGMIAWYLLIKSTGYEIGYAAWGVGVLTGFGGRKLAGEASGTLGLVAGACAFVAIIGGQYLAAKSQYDAIIEESLKEVYQSQLEFAKEAANAQTDDELKAVIAKQDEDEKGKGAAEVTEEDLAKFKTEELPRLKKIADGTTDRAAVEAEIRGALNSPLAKSMILQSSLGLFTLLWLFLGVGSAFKIAAREA